MRDLVLDLRRRAVSRVVDGVEDGLAALAARRDPVRKHERRIRRERRKLGVESAVAGGLGVLAVTAGVAPGWSVAEVGFGGAAAVVGAAALGAGRRLRQLRQHPPRPHDRPWPKRPPRDCPTRRPLDRLADRERALAGLLHHLGAAGDEPREVAGRAAATLRELGARTTAVDRARRGASPASVAGLDAAVAVLVDRIEAGVAGYDRLVVAAADAVAASATLRAGDPVLLLRLTEATDSLAGLAAGLREVAG
ncbi:MAG: phage shock envelope stress response protein PspM [Mycobacteriales bacterium]